MLQRLTGKTDAPVDMYSLRKKLQKINKTEAPAFKSSSDMKKVIEEYRQNRERVQLTIKKKKKDKATEILRSEVHMQTSDQKTNKFASQFKIMQSCYAVCPDYLVKPIELVYDAEGEAIDYRMEFINGLDLTNTIRKIKSKDLPFDRLNCFIENFETCILKLHEHGLAHGDIHGANILITEDGFKLIDPHDTSETELLNELPRLQKEDKTRIKEMLYIVDKAR